LVGQKYTTDTSKIYDDTAPDDGPFWDHMLNELEKVAGIIPKSLKVQAHPKIKSRPFNNGNRPYQLHLIVRPPPVGTPIDPGPGRFDVSFRFTVRTGCTVQVSVRDANTIDILITLNSQMYTPPDLPTRSTRDWPRDELAKLNADAGTEIIAIEGIAALISKALHGNIGAAEVVAVLERGVETDEYFTPPIQELFNIFDTNGAFTAKGVNQIPAGQGVIQNDNQPFP